MSFGLQSDNTRPTGIATNGGTLWVTDEGMDAVFVYRTDGAFLGRWDLAPENSDPSGITNDPTGGTDLWVVDRSDQLVGLVTVNDVARFVPKDVTHAVSSIMSPAPTVAPSADVADVARIMREHQAQHWRKPRQSRS